MTTKQQDAVDDARRAERTEKVDVELEAIGRVIAYLDAAAEIMVDLDKADDGETNDRDSSRALAYVTRRLAEGRCREYSPSIVAAAVQVLLDPYIAEDAYVLNDVRPDQEDAS